MGAVCLVEDRADNLASTGPLAELVARYGTDLDWIATLPVEHATVATVRVPARKRALFEKALPYALEDVLLKPIESQHFAYREPDRDGRTTVAALDRDLLKAILARFTDTGIALQGLYIDAQLLPIDEVGVAALVDGERCLFRVGEQVAALRAAEVAVAQQYASGQCTVYLPAERPHGNGAPVIGALPDLSEALSAHPITESQQWLAQRLSEANPINLLQGDFRPAVKSDRQRTLLAFAVGSVLAAVGLLLVYLLGASYNYHQRADSLHEQAVARYRELVPGSQRVVDVRKQLLAHVQASRAEAPPNRDFVEFFSDFSRAWSDAEMGESILKGLRYDQSNASAALEILNTTVSQMESFQVALSRYELKGTIVSAIQQEDDRSAVRLRIEGAR